MCGFHFVRSIYPLLRYIRTRRQYKSLKLNKSKQQYHQADFTIPIWTSDVINIQGEVFHQDHVVINLQHVTVISQVSVASSRFVPVNGVKVRPGAVYNDVSQVVEAVKFHTF